MHATTHEHPQQLVTVNVTGWSEYQRTRLINAIEKVQAEVANAPDAEAIEGSGWTKRAVTRAFQLLAGARAHAQLAVIMHAIQNGGAVTRDEVYEIAGYSHERSLKGFTRPTNNATERLRDAGEIPHGAAALLTPIYDEANPSFQKTKGFTIPIELVKLYSE